MKKIFVVTDNKFIYDAFKRLCQNKIVKVDYFCSMKSQATFSLEIEKHDIEPIDLSLSYQTLVNEKYDVGFSCHSKQIFPINLVNALTCINIHPGFNPYNRGWFPQVFSIINGMPIGATIHVMDEYIDHGDIIVQEEILIMSNDTSYDVYNKVQAKEIELIERHFDAILDGKIVPRRPPCEGNYNSIRDYKALCEIDLNKKVSMREAINYLRAMTHAPHKNAYFIDEEGNKIYLSLLLEKEYYESK